MPPPPPPGGGARPAAAPPRPQQQQQQQRRDGAGAVMAEPAELRQESVVRFLAARGGRARNAELLEHFREWLSPPEPGRRAAARHRFKELVNAVATVRQEPGTGVK